MMTRSEMLAAALDALEGQQVAMAEAKDALVLPKKIKVISGKPAPQGWGYHSDGTPIRPGK